jgi:hypothetical protein
LVLDFDAQIGADVEFMRAGDAILFGDLALALEGIGLFALCYFVLFGMLEYKVLSLLVLV